jgi:hypothetical protein
MIADILADIVPDKGQGANMTTRAEQRRLPVGLTPRLLSRSAAAAYLGMSQRRTTSTSTSPRSCRRCASAVATFGILSA